MGELTHQAHFVDFGKSNLAVNVQVYTNAAEFGMKMIESHFEVDAIGRREMVLTLKRSHLST